MSTNAYSPNKIIYIWQPNKNQKQIPSWIRLGNGHSQKISSYFQKTKVKKRSSTYMQKVVFEVIKRLRVNNQQILQTIGRNHYYKTRNSIYLTFDWLHSIPYQNQRNFSTLLKVQNLRSKREIYVLDNNQYQRFPYQFLTAIQNQRKNNKRKKIFKFRILLYDQQLENLKLIRPKLKNLTPSKYNIMKLFEVKRQPFQVRKLKKDHFQNYQCKKVFEQNTELQRKTSEQKRDFGNHRDRQLKYFFLTKNRMPVLLQRYSDSLTMVVNDMIRFVGEEKQLCIQANGKTNQIQLSIKNDTIVSFMDLKTTVRQYKLNNWDIQQQRRYIYTTQDILEQNMISFLNYVELRQVQIVKDCKCNGFSDEQSRFLLLKNVKINSQKEIKLALKTQRRWMICQFFMIVYFTIMQSLIQELRLIVKKFLNLFRLTKPTKNLLNLSTCSGINLIKYFFMQNQNLIQNFI